RRSRSTGPTAPPDALRQRPTHSRHASRRPTPPGRPSSPHRFRPPPRPRMLPHQGSTRPGPPRLITSGLQAQPTPLRSGQVALQTSGPPPALDPIVSSDRHGLPPRGPVSEAVPPPLWTPHGRYPGTVRPRRANPYEALRQTRPPLRCRRSDAKETQRTSRHRATCLTQYLCAKREHNLNFSGNRKPRVRSLAKNCQIGISDLVEGGIGKPAAKAARQMRLAALAALMAVFDF